MEWFQARFFLLRLRTCINFNGGTAIANEDEASEVEEEEGDIDGVDERRGFLLRVSGGVGACLTCRKINTKFTKIIGKNNNNRIFAT